MDIEEELGKRIEYKFKLRKEFINNLEKYSEKIILGLGNLLRPIAEPLERLLDRFYFDPEEIWTK
jgi:hypothetical protein